jgi:hypothetical protein
MQLVSNKMFVIFDFGMKVIFIKLKLKLKPEDYRSVL